MENMQENNSTARPQINSTILHIIIEKVVSDGKSISKVGGELQLKTSIVGSMIKKFQMTGRIETSTVRGHRSIRRNYDLAMQKHKFI
ncbi:hypothetical protein MXB_4077 [Myxobolus squamalis]|nr:hypothetical protein MXB_4077 [Myxobolus squamalis]